MYSRTPGPVLSALLAAICCVGAAQDSGADNNFSFSAAEQRDRDQQDAESARQAEAIAALVSAPCKQRLKNQKILLLIGEQTADQWSTNQDHFGQFTRVINTRLRSLGLNPYTQQEIKASIAQAQIDAYFKNDPDAALSASKRMGASYILRGTISTRTGMNPVVQVKEVDVNIDLTLSAADGRVLSDVNAHSDSYSGSDTLGTALSLVKEQANSLLAQLYNDFCGQ